MRRPGQAEQRLVEVHVPIDQARQHEIAVEVEHLRRLGLGGARRQDRGDDSVRDGNAVPWPEPG